MADYVKTFRALAGLIILFVGMTGPQALAQSELKFGPIYNPASKSYFELRYRFKGITWAKMGQEAGAHQFKGVQGRLAVIDSYETHAFLSENIPRHFPAWIGMYVDCKTMNVYWVNGEQQLNSKINFWNNPWYRDSRIRCSSQGISMMSVWLLPQRNYKQYGGSAGSRWVATGPHKGDHYMLVEYPTGGE